MIIMKKYKICVIDGQGGGIGSAVIKKLKEEFSDKTEITAIGTNSIATAAMLKAKANKGATGENSIKVILKNIDIIIGPISIILADSMLGELTPAMATYISSCKAKKIFLPFTQEDIEIIGLTTAPLPHMIEKLIIRLKEIINV